MRGLEGTELDDGDANYSAPSLSRGGSGPELRSSPWEAEASASSSMSVRGGRACQGFWPGLCAHLRP